MNSLEGMRVGINGVALLSPLTGIGQYTFHLVRELQKLLHDRIWLFYGINWNQTIRAAPLPGVDRMRTTIKGVVPNPYLVSRYVQQMFFSSGVRRHGIQFYHEPNFLAYRFRGPSVVTVHDLSWIRYPEMHPVERVKAMDRLMPQVLQHAAHILVDSEFVRQEVISHYGVAPERATTVLLGVSPDFKPHDRQACAPVLARYGLEYKQYMLVVGTLEPRKNLATVIAAFSRLPESVRRRMPLVVVGMAGWGRDRFPARLRQMVEAGEVRLPGYVAQSDLPMLYAGARLFVYPSLYEGFGLPPLEAMASGVPVIVSRRASLPEVVGDAGIQVEALDDLAIARHMRELLEDDELDRRHSAAGRRQAAKFTWHKCAVETLEVYKKAMEVC